MNPIVEEYLEKNADRVDRKALEKEQAFRERVVRAAGLFRDGWMEVSSDLYYETFTERKTEEDADGKTHYYKQGKIPVEVTDEEFSEICKTFTPEELEEFRSGQADEDKDIEKESASGASTFFNVLGWILLVAGFAVAVSAANIDVVKGSGYYARTEKEFSFTVFMTGFLVYIIYACFCFCAATLFRELRTITNLLRRKK